MKKFILIFFTLFIAFESWAQLPPDTKLMAHYSFNFPNLATDSSDKNAKAQTSPIPPDTVCGIDGNAMALRGDQFMFLYDISAGFSTTNFTISFYFKPNNSIGLRDIFSNTDSCKNERAFQIQYDAALRAIRVKMKDEKRGIEMIGRLESGKCWNHVVFVREGNYHRLYINGVRKEATYSPDNQRINLLTPRIFTLGKNNCNPNITGSNLRGFVDEFRGYSIAVSEDEAAALYDSPDRLKKRDELIFIGQSVTAEAENTCATKFLWSPTTGVEDVNAAKTNIKPSAPGVFKYVVRMSDATSTCIAYDTVKITVIDPTLQPCGEVFVPNAFTPNNDGKNDTYGLSNPYTIGTLENFEVVDRWGSVLFATTDPFLRWDGTFNGRLVEPGPYLYRIRYQCQGEKKSQFGSLLLMQ